MISVIVPVYNTEPYLHHCIDSILAQTFTDFELLLIDDGSTDSSGSICDEFAAKDSRVRVFHKANGGVSSARNMGLDNAHGEWVAFVDADDLLYPDFLKTFVTKFSQSVDLYIQGYEDSNGYTLVRTERSWVSECLVVELDDIYLDQLFGFVWNKLYKAVIIKDNGLRFNEQITMIEDLLFIYDYLQHSNSAYNINAVNYYYWRHESSACFKKHSFHSWNLFIDKYCNLFSQYKDTHKDFVNRKLKTCYMLSLDILRSLYIDRCDSMVRISFIGKIKNMADSSEAVQIRTMTTFNNKLITFMVLYLPVTLADKLLWMSRKILSVKR